MGDVVKSTRSQYFLCIFLCNSLIPFDLLLRFGLRKSLLLINYTFLGLDFPYHATGHLKVKCLTLNNIRGSNIGTWDYTKILKGSKRESRMSGVEWGTADRKNIYTSDILRENRLIWIDFRYWLLLIGIAELYLNYI